MVAKIAIRDAESEAADATTCTCQQPGWAFPTKPVETRSSYPSSQARLKLKKGHVVWDERQGRRTIDFSKYIKEDIVVLSMMYMVSQVRYLEPLMVLKPSKSLATPCHSLPLAL